MRVGPPDQEAGACFVQVARDMASAYLPPQLAERLFVKTDDDPASNMLRLSIFFKTGMERQRWGFDLDYKSWHNDQNGCIAAVGEWVAGVLQAVAASGGASYAVEQAIKAADSAGTSTDTIVLPAGADKWSQDNPAPPPRKPKTTPTPARHATPEPLPVPGERHIELED